MKTYTIKEVKPNIFLLTFKDQYDLCMQFLRYQEYYGSPSPKFRNKQFTILEYMRWYTKKYGNGSFTYPSDWNGFNLPGSIIPTIYNSMIPDRNIYDYNMLLIYKHCKKVSNDFYLIGATKNNKRTINHEIAHGFFYTNKLYRKTMKNLVKALPIDIRNQINSELKHIGYVSKVFIDEIQAYLSTGFDDVFSPNLTTAVNPFYKPFVKVYNEFNKSL